MHGTGVKGGVTSGQIKGVPSSVSLEANGQLILQILNAGKITKMLSQKLCLLRVLLEPNTKVRRTVLDEVRKDEGQDGLGELWEVNAVIIEGVNPDTTDKEELVADFLDVFSPSKQYGTKP